MHLVFVFLKCVQFAELGLTIDYSQMFMLILYVVF
jgi:hypothetical protein